MPEKLKQLVEKTYGLISHFEMHDDELLERWILLTFGEKILPGIRQAARNLMLVDSGIRELNGKTGAEWFAAGWPCLGTLGGPLDEHDLPPEERKNASAATLAAKMVGIEQYAPIKAMLAHAVRVDRTPTASNFDISSIIKSFHRVGMPIQKVCAYYDRIADAWFMALSGKVRNPQWEDRPSFDDLARGWLIALLAPKGYVANPKLSTPEIVIEFQFADSRPLAPLLHYIIREDRHDIQGTQADDHLFELRGIVDVLNQYGAPPKEVREFVFDALHAKYAEQCRFLAGLDELNALRKAGTLYIKGTRWRMVYVISDNPEINRAVRRLDPYCDIFIQRNTDGHLIVWYNKDKLTMDQVIANLRMADMYAANKKKLIRQDLMMLEGTLPEAPWWYYNPANGQIMNGSRTNRKKPCTFLSHNRIVSAFANYARLITA